MKIKQLRLDTIDEIEACPECTANEYAFMKRLNFKGCFNLYFVDFGGYFGKSMLVYRNNHHIYYANDYELHYNYMGWTCIRTGEPEFFGVYNLIKWYLHKANETLFSDDEILNQPIKTYGEYSRKEHYVRNYAILQFDRVSLIYIGEKQKAEVERRLKAMKTAIRVPGFFSCVSSEEEARYLVRLLRAVHSRYDTLIKDNDFFRGAICYELSNHEACITGEYDEALYSLGLSMKELEPCKQVIVIEELRKQVYGHA